MDLIFVSKKKQRHYLSVMPLLFLFNFNLVKAFAVHPDDFAL